MVFEKNKVPSDHQTRSIWCHEGIHVDFVSILHSLTPLVRQAYTGDRRRLFHQRECFKWMVAGPQSRVWSGPKRESEVYLGSCPRSINRMPLDPATCAPDGETFTDESRNPSTIQFITYRILVEMWNVQEKFYIERQVNMSIGNLQLRWNGETLILNSACSPE